MYRIALTSCSKTQGDYSMPIQPAWGEIEATSPDFLLLLGDNAYMSQSSRERWQKDSLEKAYQRLFEETHFASLIAKVPFMATWDDHDFGPNDSAGDSEADRPHRDWSRALFHRFMGKAINDRRPEINCSAVVGDDIKIIVLDGRYHRTRRVGSKRTILGVAQEAWLAQELKDEHRVTIVACGTALGGGGDGWGGYPLAEDRFKTLLSSKKRLLYVAGDLHFNDFRTHRAALGSSAHDFHEVISSGVGRLEKFKDKSAGPPLNHFAVLDIGKKRIDVHLHRRGIRKTHAIDWASWAAT